MDPDQIARQMTGRLAEAGEGRLAAFLPSPDVQNHAAFLHLLPDGALICAWFGGSLEGRADISIRASVLAAGAPGWGPAQALSDDPEHSEQNPVIFAAPDGGLWLFHTSQPAGNQDECRIRMARLHREGARLTVADGRFLDLPRGCFVRAAPFLRPGGGWALPIFRCRSRPGQRWTGAHDSAAVGVSSDDGASWRLEDVADSTGAVHMCPVALGGGRMAAFYRRRQADFVHRSDSGDGGVSWSAPVPVAVPNNNSSIAVTRLRDGRLAMICNPVNAAMSAQRRASLYDELAEGDGRPDADPQGGCTPVWGVPRAPVALCLSEDGGRSFPRRLIVEDGPGTCLSNNSTDGRNKELSYPWLVEAADGALHVAYTWHRRAIRHVRLAPGWDRAASEVTA